jgi:hypothetical protein
MFIEAFKLILDWSEVWALLIPLTVLFIKPKQPLPLKPIIIYICLALLINLLADIISIYWKHLPNWFNSNTVLYNIHSVVRYSCFAYFFLLLSDPFYSKVKKLILVAGFLLFVINFTLSEQFYDPNQISGNLLALESYLLLIYCMLFYLSQLRSDTTNFINRKEFWVVTGLSIYVVINFFVFLFYNPMLKENTKLALSIWKVHDIAYIILCIFIAKAFFVPAKTSTET